MLELAVAGTFALTSAVVTSSDRFPVCDSITFFNCVADLETVWIEGVRYSLAGIDGPAPGKRAKCLAEGRAARSAAMRLSEILSDNVFIIEADGDNPAGAIRASFVVSNTTAEEILIAEGWVEPLRTEPADWCQSSRP